MEASPATDTLYVVAIGALWSFPLSRDGSAVAGEPTQLRQSSTSLVREMAVAADGRQIAYTAMSIRSNLVSPPIDPVTYEPVGAPRFLTSDSSLRNNFPDFSPDGTKIAFRRARPGSGSNIWLIDADGSEPRQLTSARRDYLPFSLPDGQRLIYRAIEGEDDALHSLDIQSRRRKRIHTL